MRQSVVRQRAFAAAASCLVLGVAAGCGKAPRPAATDSADISPATNAVQAAPSRIPVTAARHVAIAGVDLTGVGYDRGDPKAPVVVVDLSDFGCPYCGEFSRETYPQLDREYVTTGKVFFKYLPFVVGTFPHAGEATRAAECAAEQGQFWEMFDRIYRTQAEWRRGGAADAQMAALAGTTRVDTARFATCYRDHHTDALTARATDVANELGVRVTPSFLVNDRPIQGALPWAEFRKVIDAALMTAPLKH